MQDAEPRAFLIARPQIDWENVREYLELVGGKSWWDRRVPGVWDGQASTGEGDAEALIEFSGRQCYRSWEPGLNANVTRVREDQDEYLGNILGVGHGSVLEHAQFSFVFHEVSRVMTHEVVRHRVGCAISQESLRFVRLDDVKMWMPSVFREAPEWVDYDEHDQLMIEFEENMERLEQWQVKAAQVFRLDDDGVPFARKKEVTSAMRRAAPIGLATSMVWSANIRTLRHVISMRTAGGAEEEIRIIFQQVAEMMKEEAPALFGDYERNEAGEYFTSNWKV